MTPAQRADRLGAAAVAAAGRASIFTVALIRRRGCRPRARRSHQGSRAAASARSRTPSAFPAAASNPSIATSARRGCPGHDANVTIRPRVIFRPFAKNICPRGAANSPGFSLRDRLRLSEDCAPGIAPESSEGRIMKRSRRVVLTMMGSAAVGAVSMGFTKRERPCGSGLDAVPGLDGKP